MSELETIEETYQRATKDIAEQQAIIDSDEQTKIDLGEQVATAQREFLRLEEIALKPKHTLMNSRKNERRSFKR